MRACDKDAKRVETDEHPLAPIVEKHRVMQIHNLPFLLYQAYVCIALPAIGPLHGELQNPARLELTAADALSHHTK
jgi:hypothetical protein